MLVLLALALLALVVYVVGDKTFNASRSLFNYISIYLISHATVCLLRLNKINVFEWIVASLWLALAIGFIQLVYDRDFFTFLTGGYRSTADRGVVSLFVEPSFYATFLVFTLIFSIHFNDKLSLSGLLGVIVGVLFLAESSIGILYLLLFSFFLLAAYLFESRKSMVLLIILLCIATFVYLSTIQETSNRIGKLLEYRSLYDLWTSDVSVYSRSIHILVSFHSMLENYMLPNGFNAWQEHISNSELVDSLMGNFFTGRIMSGYGAGFFELGLLSGGYILVIYYLALRAYKHSLLKGMAMATFINVLMFSAISLAYPLLSVYIGCLYHSAYNLSEQRA